MEATLYGYDMADLGYALDVMEKEVAPGQWARLQFCTESPPTQAMLDKMYLDILNTGHVITEPTFEVIQGIPTTTFNIQRDMPYEQYQWQLLIPVIGTLATLGVIVYAITRLGDITSALMPIILTVGGVLIIAIALLRKPATTYIEKGGKIPGLPATKMRYLTYTRMIEPSDRISLRAEKYLPAMKPEHGEQAEHYLKRLDAEIKSLWNKSLDYDEIPRDSKFVIFSKENPYQKEYNELMTEKLKWQRIINAGGGLQHHPGQQFLNMNLELSPASIHWKQGQPQVERKDAEVYMSLPPFRVSIWVDDKKKGRELARWEDGEARKWFEGKFTREQVEADVLDYLESKGIIAPTSHLSEETKEELRKLGFDAKTQLWLPKTKHDPLKYAESILTNNLFEESELPLYSGMSGTNPMGVPDFIWQTAFAEAGGKFVKLGQLYTIAGGNPMADPGLAPATKPVYVEIDDPGDTELVQSSVVLLETVEKVNKKMASLNLRKATYWQTPKGASLADEGGKVWPGGWAATQDNVQTDLEKSISEEKKATEDYQKRSERATLAHDQRTSALYDEVRADEKEHMEEFKKRLADKSKLGFIPDSQEYMAETIKESGYREKLDQAFTEAIERLKKK